MNDDHVLVRPLFRVLYGIVSVLFVWGIFLGLFAIVRMLDDKVIRIGELLTWSMFATISIFVWFAYTTFIIALRGKPPKYLAKYIDKYQKQIDKKG